MTHKAHFVFILIFVFIANTNAEWGHGCDSVLLSDVKALTFSRGQYTTGRRSSPIPQLQCVGGDACSSSLQPTTVQCLNRGEDYTGNIQWKCDAELDTSVRFGRTDVSCEGYNNPNDPYILRGSCGVEYTLEFTDQGRRAYSHSQHNHYASYDHNYYGDSNSSNFGKFVLWGILIIVIFGLLYQCSQNMNRPGATTSTTYGPGTAPGYGGYPPSAPGYGPGSAPGYGGYPPSPSYSSGPRPGFWSGFGTGGMLGYLFGRSPGYGYSGYNSGWSRPSFGGSRGYSGSSFGSSFGGSSTRSSSGFGSTRRR